MSLARTILVAEDDLVHIFLLARAFRLVGNQYTVRYVRNSLRLIKYLKRQAPYTDRKEFPDPDLLIADQWMAQPDNYLVLRIVRLQPAFRGLPITVLLDTDNPEDLRRCTESPASAFYLKKNWRPRYPELVQQILRQFLGDGYLAAGTGDS